MEFKHKSVLLNETIDGLRVKPDGIYVDGTLGGAGHATEVCKKLSAKGRFIGIDQDQDAIIAASERLAPYKQATIIRSNYCYMVQELAAAEIPYAVLNKVMNRIINEVKGVNRVFYDLTSKPPGTIEFE